MREALRLMLGLSILGQNTGVLRGAQSSIQRNLRPKYDLLVLKTEEGERRMQALSQWDFELMNVSAS